MHYLLFIGAFLFFAFIAPLKVTLWAVILLLVVTLVIRVTTRVVAGADTSYGDALKAMGLSFFFMVIAIFTLISLSAGTGVTQFQGLSGLLVFGAFLGAYALGFKLSLGVSFGASLVVAIVSSVVSTLLFVGLKTVA
jgi:hypothetical protein